MKKSKNRSLSIVTKRERNNLNQHNSGVIWLYGLSSSGKTTIAYTLERILFKQGIRTYVLDGDKIRKGLSRDLNFSIEHRKENIRRIAEVAKIMADAGLVVIMAFIAPFKEDRNIAQETFGSLNFLEIYLKCPLEVCMARDPKGLYKKALKGEIKQFTGISSPFEEPEKCDLVLDTSILSIEECLKQITDLIEKKGFLKM